MDGRKEGWMDGWVSELFVLFIVTSSSFLICSYG